MMQRLGLRFGGLYWRLISSYFLVTLVAALIVEIAITLPVAIQEFQQSIDAVRFARLLEEHEAPLVAPYLAQDRLDLSALQYLLTGTIRDAMAPVHPVLYLGIVDRNQHVVTSSPNCLQEQISDHAQQVICTGQPIGNGTFVAPIRAALAGQTDPVQLVAATPSSTLIATPIRSDVDRRILGALVAVIVGSGSTSDMSTPSALSRFLDIFWNHVRSDGLYFILLASAIGTLTGWLIMRNVTGRLHQITQAAKSWSNGDFEAVAHDMTRDEIGQLAQDLNSMAAQIQTLLTTREALAVVEERNRLARDLHDSVKQHIFANALLINAARNLLEQHPEQVGEHLQQAEHLAQQAQDELATLIRALRPAALADKGLVAVLQDYVNEWSARTGIAVTLHIGGERATRLAIEETLLRVGQEALANIARHSGATGVSVVLTWQEDEISMAIADDGHGFHTEDAPRGVGLTSMHERVGAVAGTLTIDSSPAGTTIRAMIPLSEMHQAEEVRI